MRLAMILLLLIASPGYATSYGRPERHDVFSKNRAFVLDVNPETGLHRVFDVRDRTKPLWGMAFWVWHFPILLSDDGTVVATLAWKYVRVQDIDETEAITFWNKDGAFRSHLLSDLCPDPMPAHGGPVGDFWRSWLSDVSSNGDSLSVRTIRGVSHRFRFADGERIKPDSAVQPGPHDYRRKPENWLPQLPLWVLAVAWVTVLLFVLWRRQRANHAKNSG